MTGQMRVGAAPLFPATAWLSPQALLLLSLLLATQQGINSGNLSLGYGILEQIKAGLSLANSCFWVSSGQGYIRGLDTGCRHSA